MQAAWDESLVITGEDIAQVEDIDDDLSRELAFYNQVGQMQSSPLPFRSPVFPLLTCRCILQGVQHIAEGRQE